MPDDIRTLCNFAITLHYEGAAATVVFDECGAAGFPRERLSVFAHGQVAILDDFAKLTEFGSRRRTKGTGLHRSMGLAEELEQFVRAIKGEPNHLLSWEDASLATLCMFAAQESIRLGAEIDLRQFRSSLLTPADRISLRRRRQRHPGLSRQRTRRRPNRTRLNPGSPAVTCVRRLYRVGAGLAPRLSQLPHAAATHQSCRGCPRRRVAYDRNRPGKQGDGERYGGGGVAAEGRDHDGLAHPAPAGANTARNPTTQDRAKAAERDQEEVLAVPGQLAEQHVSHHSIERPAGDRPPHGSGQGRRCRPAFPAQAGGSA